MTSRSHLPPSSSSHDPHPLVIPVQCGGIALAGFVSYPTRTGLGEEPVLVMQDDEKKIIVKCKDPVPQLSTTTSTVEAINELMEYRIKNTNNNNGKRTKPCNSGICARIINDLNVVGLHTIIDMSVTFDWVTIQIKDGVGRRHDIKINLHLETGHPCVVPAPICQLPVSLRLPAPCPTHVYEVVEIFQEEVNKFQDLWHELDEIDSTFQVSDPVVPGASRSITYRRLILNVPTSFLHVQLVPITPKSVPSMDFIGPERDIGALRDGLDKLVQNWNVTMGVCENLKSLGFVAMKTQSVTATIVEKKESNVVATTECGVCYSYRLTVEEGGNETNNNDHNGYQLPDTLCESCRRPFHQACLSEWLRSIPSCSKRTFQQLVGDCPYCGCTISCVA